MVVQSFINELIAQFKATYRKGAITPKSLGELLENIVEAAKPTVLTVNVSESKTKFVNDEQFMHVWSAMQQNQQVSFCICINYASGSKNFYYPTCVKSNYISLHAKAGSCELHLIQDATFTISGTNLW